MTRDRDAPDEGPPTVRLRYRCIHLPNGGEAMRTALWFMAAAQVAWTLGELLAWFDERLVAPGWMTRPSTFHEHGVMAIPAPPRTDARASAGRITKAACARVLAVLGDPRASIEDGRFLQAAILARRVKRAGAKSREQWIAKPRETDALSDVVLSLFAADILSDPAFYREHLCVCRACARVSIEPRDIAAARLCSSCCGSVRADAACADRQRC